VPTWRSVIVIPITSSPRQALRDPTVVPVSGAESGLGQSTIAVCHQITTLDRSKIGTRIGRLSATELNEVEQGIFAACTSHRCDATPL